MTPSDLKREIEEKGTAPHFFTRKTMRFFGDTMKNYAVSGPLKITDNMDEERLVYELRRKKPVKHGLKDSAYFDAETFYRVHKRKA